MSKKLIPLATFIESIKSELLEYQTKHAGKPALFEISEIEITASVITKWESEAKASIFAVGIGAAGKQEGTHTVRMKMRIPSARAGTGSSDVKKSESPLDKEDAMIIFKEERVFTTPPALNKQIQAIVKQYENNLKNPCTTAFNLSTSEPPPV